jgi:hypothetical protein
MFTNGLACHAGGSVLRQRLGGQASRTSPLPTRAGSMPDTENPSPDPSKSVISLASDPTKADRIYLRVSTDGQTVEIHRREPQAVAERHGWEAVAEINDRGISGAK